MNTEMIRLNIDEALDELTALKKEIDSGDFGEVDFQIKLQHIYHHLNVAWNARDQSTDRYQKMSNDDFETWGKFPEDL